MSNPLFMTSFLIEYNRRSGEVNVTPYDSTKEATRARIAKTRTRTNRDIEVVAVRSPSIEALRRSHSRYFMRERELIA